MVYFRWGLIRAGCLLVWCLVSGNCTEPEMLGGDFLLSAHLLGADTAALGRVEGLVLWDAGQQLGGINSDSVTAAQPAAVTGKAVIIYF